ncbi:hypothetical protein CH291_06910 [Rhodococcus sp. 14-1411-2a]|nr:hypothetical protein CH291_06910 [Rhodococcus sp. 14-1411-2a]
MPQYRLAFFQRLSEKLESSDIDLTVYYGETPPEWKKRNDSRTPDGMFCLPTKFTRFGGRLVSRKDVSDLRSAGPFDLLILEQAIRNVETYQIVLNQRRYCKDIAMWGHGRTYTKKKTNLEERLKQALTRKSSWFFGYTDAGVQEVERNGFPSSSTTVVQNTIDADSLRRDLSSVTAEEIAEFESLHSLGGTTAVYVGGLDSAKKIPFLLDSARIIRDMVPDFTLLVIGSGDLAGMVEKVSSNSHHVVYLGPLFGKDKALALRSASIMLNPGRVGLVAVDSLCSGLPIVTTDWEFHAPEFEYLTDGSTCLVSSSDVEVYAHQTVSLFNNPQRLRLIQQNCMAQSAQFSTDDMVARFATGIECALERGD